MVWSIFIKRQTFLKKLLGNKVFPFLTNEIFCDIDSKKDFKIAELIAGPFLK